MSEVSAEKGKIEATFVKKRNGRLEPLNIDKINRCAERACVGLFGVSSSEIVLDAHVQLYNKVSTSEIDKSLILSARSKIEKEPNYAYAAARILANTIYKEVFGEGADADGFELQYRKAFIVNLKKLVKADRLNPALLEFDLKRLADALIVENDNKFKYFGLQTLYDRYFIHIDGRRMETPQAFWMRVAMGLALNSKDREATAIEIYKTYSNFLYCSSTPTLFNSGSLHPQLSSCYLSTVHDSIDGIFGTLHGQARLSKHAGGLGVDWTPIRGTGSYIKGTNGKSQGLIPWLKVFNDLLVSVNQGGVRKGAGCSYLETWHIDVEDFLDLRKNTGDDRRRCHDMHTANWIPDLFMERIKQDGDWYLFSPCDVPGLHDTFGDNFLNKYLEYCKKADSGEIKNHRKIKAKDLWRKMLIAIKETGDPWMTFKDPSNIRYSNQHIGIVHNSNLCCMTADQRVITTEGIFTVGELYERGENNVVAGRKGIVDASEMMLPRPDAPIVKIKTKQGYSHKVTPDHKVWVSGKGWTEAQNLKIGDKLELQQYHNVWGQVNKPDEAYRCGESASYLVSETTEIDGQSQFVKKSIPDFVWKGNQATAESYIRGIANWGLSMKGEDGPLYFVTLSDEITPELQILLLNMGVRSQVAEFGMLMIDDQYDKCLLRSIVYPGKFNHPGKRDKADFFAEFAGLEELPNEDAYCLSVYTDEHSWTVNGMITKNTEILLHTIASLYNEGIIEKVGETAVCNLGSINLHETALRSIVDGKFCKETFYSLLRETVRIAIRALDSVIDLNFYPTAEAKNANLNNRPIGLGIMGFHDVLHLMDLTYESDEAREFSGDLQEVISHEAILTSTYLAEESGTYPTYKGSLWDQGKLPIDTYNDLMKIRGVDEVAVGKQDWSIVRERVAKYGMRNSNTMAIAPTATISDIQGCEQSIEPNFSCLHSKSTLSGDFTMLNEHLVRKAKAAGIWCGEFLDALKQVDGSLSSLNVPQELKDEFKTAFEIDQLKLVDCAAERQKWIDMGQSLNLYYDDPRLKPLSDIYFHAWERGLKTTYYLRSKSASKIEKSTVAKKEYTPEEKMACSINNPEACEACQ